MELFSEHFENFMGKNMKNYLDLTLIEAYNVLVDNRDPWPSRFEMKKKVRLINSMIEYFTSTEEYEKCQELIELKRNGSVDSISISNYIGI